MEHDELTKKAHDFIIKDEAGTVSKPTEDAGDNQKQEAKKK